MEIMRLIEGAIADSTNPRKKRAAHKPDAFLDNTVSMRIAAHTPLLTGSQNQMCPQVYITQS